VLHGPLVANRQPNGASAHRRRRVIYSRARRRRRLLPRWAIVERRAHRRPGNTRLDRRRGQTGPYA